MAQTRKPRVLSGVQPSGRLHLGNYFGAIKQHIELQETAECFYFIADYHSLTTVADAQTLRDNVRDVAVTYLALGLDPARTVFYRQSDVPEVCELTWVLSAVTGMGLLERAHSYKDKIARGISPTVALFTYPVLMAADILGPQADIVPVGQDQKQHVEMTRDMAIAFNAAFAPGDDEPVFRLPEATFTATPKVPGTTFEKGDMLMIATEFRAEPGDLDAGPYVATIREQVARAVAEDPAIRGTEPLVPLIEAAHAGTGLGLPIARRDLRVTSDPPPGEFRITPSTSGFGLEFAVPLPRTIFATDGGKRVAAKMSKSYGNTIEIFASGKPLKKSVMGIETDQVPLEAALDPDDCLVVALYRLFASDDEVAELEANYRAGGFGYGSAKKALLGKINDHFGPFRERREELLANPDEVEDVLRDGAARARKVIAATTEAARHACGIR
jgi:tryptophanyl-tRNA synthetase